MAARRYAQRTKVTIESSRTEIERLVRRCGATAFGWQFADNRDRIIFEARGRRLRFELARPDSRRFPSASAFDAESRRLWRCLLLCIKSKFEAVENGIAVFDEEFLANIVVPTTGETVAHTIAAQLVASYRGDTRAPLMLGPGSPQ